MTTYQGGKKRIGKKIYKVISLVEKEINPDKHLPYFEPFVGMASVLSHFGDEGKRDLFACDVFEDLILMWREVQNDWKPPLKITKKEYDELKEDNPSAKRAFVGTVSCYGGNFFQGYRLHSTKERDYVREGHDGILKVKKSIVNVEFMDPQSYDNFNPDGFLIYCDPPYKGNKLLDKRFRNFDHDLFWKTMRKWSKNNTVLISESTAPKDFKQVWCKQSHVSNSSATTRYQDYIFIHQSLYKKISNNAKNLISQIK